MILVDEAEFFWFFRRFSLHCLLLREVQAFQKAILLAFEANLGPSGFFTLKTNSSLRCPTGNMLFKESGKKSGWNALVVSCKTGGSLFVSTAQLLERPLHSNSPFKNALPGVTKVPCLLVALTVGTDVNLQLHSYSTQHPLKPLVKREKATKPPSTKTQTTKKVKKNRKEKPLKKNNQKQKKPFKKHLVKTEKPLKKPGKAF